MLAIRIRRFVLLAAALALAPALNTIAHADPVFSTKPTAVCVSAATTASPSLSGSAVLECVGNASQACINTPGGDSTMGMMDCLQQELDYWDKKLNAAYAKRLAIAKKYDAQLVSPPNATENIEDSLRKMQRAWISFRDASCIYEQSQWMGGTGAGPAGTSCYMEETARQALKLEGWWSQ
jgi:uncharacterized protein YecT (DUF1311 family)